MSKALFCLENAKDWRFNWSSHGRIDIEDVLLDMHEYNFQSDLEEDDVDIVMQGSTPAEAAPVSEKGGKGYESNLSRKRNLQSKAASSSTAQVVRPWKEDDKASASRNARGHSSERTSRHSKQ